MARNMYRAHQFIGHAFFAEDPDRVIAWASGPFGISRTAYLTVQWGMSGFWQTDARARHNPDGLTLKMNRPLQRR